IASDANVDVAQAVVPIAGLQVPGGVEQPGAVYDVDAAVGTFALKGRQAKVRMQDALAFGIVCFAPGIEEAVDAGQHGGTLIRARGRRWPSDQESSRGCNQNQSRRARID